MSADRGSGSSTSQEVAKQEPVLRLYHGGIPGLRVGDELLPSPPHYVDGCAICAAKARGEDTEMDPLTRRPDRVYLTSDLDYARFYASKYPYGDLYVVEAAGCERSPEDMFPSWTAPRAHIVSVLGRHIRQTRKQRRALFHRWPKTESDKAMRYGDLVEAARRRTAR